VSDNVVADNTQVSDREYPPRPIPAVHAAIVEQGRILMIQRAHPPSQGRWSLPGGGIELGETVQEAVMREVREECGLEIAVKDLIQVLDNIIYDEQGRIRFHYVLTFVLAQRLSGEARPSSDALDVRWVTPEILQSLDVTSRARGVVWRAFVMADRIMLAPPEKGTPGPDAEVTLREVTAETVRQVCTLSDTLSEGQKRMVAPNVRSLAEAYVSEHAWVRAVYAAGTPVGFLMLYDNPQEQEYFLWRFMIAGPYQGLGFGRRALELLVAYVRTRPGATELLTSCAQGVGSPIDFYRELGFEPTSEMVGAEIGLRLAL
jgi:diamine N-acetyltransferase